MRTVIICIIAFFLNSCDKGGKSIPMEMRIPFTVKKSFNYDPSRIEMAEEANIISLLYGRLVEFDLDGNVIPSLAKSFSWEGDVLVFEFENEETAIDSKLSLVRNLIRDSGTHGSLKLILCPSEKVTVLEKDYKCLKRIGTRLQLKPEKSEYQKFLLPLLANKEQSILPREAYDQKTLEIIDYKKTTGHFYLESYDAVGKAILRSNIKNPSFPEKIILIDHKILGRDLLSLIETDKIDAIPPYGGGFPSKYIRYFKNKSDFNLFKTYNLKSFLLNFTARGMSDLTLERRRIIGIKIRDALRKTIDVENGMEFSDTFFGFSSDGELTEDQLKEIVGLNLEAQRNYNSEEGDGVIFQTYPEAYVYFKKSLEKVLPKMKIVAKDFRPSDTIKNSKSSAHVFPINTDSSFRENYSLLNYMLSIHWIFDSKEELEKWRKNYVNTIDKKDRIKMIREMHYKMLKQCSIVPMFTSPYIYVFKSPWKIEKSKMFAGYPLWKLRQN